MLFAFVETRKDSQKEIVYSTLAMSFACEQKRNVAHWMYRVQSKAENAQKAAYIFHFLFNFAPRSGTHNIYLMHSLADVADYIFSLRREGDAGREA
jgi:hypothetical protein